ncbi:MAG: phage tail tape measure protein, partial [Candidatus Spyradenecus sp.]
MAGKVYEIAFKLAGQLSGDFAATFKAASNAMKGFGGELNKINAQAAQVDRIITMRKEVGEAARTYLQAKQRVAELGRAMSQTTTPTKEMVAEFNRAQAATTKAKNALDRKRESLRALEKEAGTTGQSLKTLVQRHKELEAAADRARVSQERFNNTLKGIRGSIDGMKATASYAAMTGAAMGAGVAGAVGQAMNFEDQRAELRKFTDDYEKTFTGIQGLMLRYGKSAEDMTNMATAAMQAGVAKNGEEALKIVEAQTQAAVAFSMTGDEIGTAWAGIQSKMGLTVDQTKNMFDIINKLGNETSASSADIVEVLQRQGGTLRGTTALNERQIAALAGAFRSASSSSEVAATSMATFIGRLTNGEAATTAQKKALGELGLDAVELSKQFTGSSESAQAAIQEVFAKINELPDYQKGAVIGQLFGTEAGIKSAVSTLAKQSQLLGGNLEMIADEASYSGSMLAEYASRADTTSEAIKIAKNATALMAGQIGDTL